jgi:TRAP-type uncharacterized transport system substrate-binding protein
LAIAAALVLACVSASFQPAEAQTAAAQKRVTTIPREVYREQMNENVLYLMGGQLGTGYIVIAHDISVVVNDGLKMRVLPVVGQAAVQNLRDVVFLRGVDLAITNVLTLDNMRRTGELGPHLERQVAYIAPLFLESVQVLVRPEINSMEDLKGKRVAFNNKGSGTALFAPGVFKTLHIDVQEFYMGQGDAIVKMRNGELEGTVCTCPVPIPAYSNAKPEWGFKLLQIPYTQGLEAATYLPSRITAAEYPNLIPKDGSIETVATSSALVAFNWQVGTVRYNKIAKFVDALFSKFADLQKPPRHPIWKTINLAGSIPGWQRFPAAQEWIENAAQGKNAALQTSFSRFLAEKKKGGDAALNAAAQERLFREFLEWSKSNR